MIVTVPNLKVRLVKNDEFGEMLEEVDLSVGCREYLKKAVCYNCCEQEFKLFVY
jgi:hypothetical protein